MVFTTERKQLAKVIREDNEKICTIDDFLLISTTPDKFFLHQKYFPSHVKDIELQTRGQSNNSLRLAVHKYVIVSKGQAVKTRMASIDKAKDEGKVLDMASNFRQLLAIPLESDSIKT